MWSSGKTLDILIKMKLKKVAKKQIDEIMDYENFEEAVESLKAVEHCWLNKLDIDEREQALRRKCRSRLEDTAQEVIYRYKNEVITFYDDKGCKFYDYDYDSGCISIRARICDRTIIGKSPWFRINLTIYCMDTIMDGKSFKK
jgi:hypothetical protein